MPRPKPLAHLDAPAYPSLVEARGSRRGFLRSLALGGLTATLGGRLLMACDASGGELHEGTTSEDPTPRERTPRDRTPRETPRTPPAHPYEEEPWGGGAPITEVEHQVRLPAEGWAWASEMTDDWGGEGWDVAFAVVFTTWDFALAEHFQADPEAGIAAVRELVLDSSCAELEDQPDWLPGAVGEALAKRYTEDTGLPGGGFAAVELLIDNCAEWFAAGGLPDPGY